MATAKNNITIPENTSIYSVIGMLSATTKINEKIQILKAVKTNPVFSEILRLTYDSNINFYVSKAEPQKVGTLDIQTDWGFISTTLINNLSSRRVTGNAAKNMINNLLENYNQHSQHVVNLILSRDLRCNIGATLINKAYGCELVPEFKVQLCNTYDETKKYKTKKWFATPKLDGIRGFWKAATPTILYSRNGKTHIGLDHIITDISKLLQKVPNITFLDGELLVVGHDFNDIQGNIMSTVNYNENEKEKVSFNIFAIGREEKWNDTTEMNDFLAAMYSLTNELKTHDHTCKSLNFIPAIQIDNTKNEVYKMASEFTSLGYEGIVLRDPLESYNFKRSNSLVKFKFFNEMDLTIIDTIEGTGKYAGALGALVATGENNISTEIGTGFNDELRRILWEKRENIIGNTVTVKYQDVSTNSNGGYSLRFPVFIGMKTDR